MIDVLLLGAGVALIAYAFYKWATLNNDYFTVHQPKVPYLKPNFLLGTTGSMLFGVHHMDTWCKWMYNSLPGAPKVIGAFDFRNPMFVLRDPELIKQMIVKDFDHFENHRQFVDDTVDDMFGNSLFLMHGERWRDMRATLSPAFTGSKMRLMFEMVTQCASDMVQVLSDRSAETGSMRAPVKDLFGRYATDVIATAAFGIKVNSFTDETNEFYTFGKRMMNFSNVATVVKLLMIRMCPAVMRALNIQFINGEAGQFFKSMALDTMRQRLEKGIYRPDMINLLLELKKNGGKAPAKAAADSSSSDGKDQPDPDHAGFATVEESHIGKGPVTRTWSDTELAAQCFLFFAAGYDTTSTALSFLCYELAVNADAQEKLYAECCAVRDGLPAGKLLGYDTLQRMPYMDQVVSESLRMWPQVLLLDRLCSKDYAYDDGELQFTVRKDDMVWLPVFAIHRDAQYWPEPDRFRPERFSEENKGSIVTAAYLPFGIGPRNCIGSRFALMEVKAIIYHILLKFTIEPTQETLIPMRLSKAPGAMKPEKDIVVAFKRRAD